MEQRIKSEGLHASEKIQWYLEAVSDQKREWMVPVEPFPFIIGRDEDCALKLVDKRISRHHAEIRKNGDHLWIRDLESTNGTFVNHRKIDQSELLESGSLISIGNYDFYLKFIKSNPVTTASKTIAIDISQELSYLDSMRPKLRKLLSERNVIPHFQPIVKISDRSVMGYEILGRIPDGELPPNPSELLELAQWLGYASDLSTLFREKGVDIGSRLSGSPALFVNTSPVEFSNWDYLMKSLERLRDRAPSTKIVFEIHEKAITEPKGMSRFRSELRKRDMGLAFDDFGVGESRLMEIAKAPPDFLKFDQSLIHHIHLAPRQLHQMVSTFVSAAQDLGIATVAEGIECSDEADACQELGFDFAQGFFFGKPLPIGEINPDS